MRKEDFKKIEQSWYSDYQEEYERVKPAFYIFWVMVMVVIFVFMQKLIK